MGYNRKSAAIFSSNKQMQPMHSREMFHSKNKTKSQQKKGNLFTVPPQKEAFVQNFQWPGNKKQQHRVGTATKRTSVIPEECGRQATPLSSA